MSAKLYETARGVADSRFAIAGVEGARAARDTVTRCYWRLNILHHLTQGSRLRKVCDHLHRDLPHRRQAWFL